MTSNKFVEMCPEGTIIESCVSCDEAEDDVDGEQDGCDEGLGQQPLVTPDHQKV